MLASILSAAQQTVLERLATVSQVGTFYLAGGTALALQIGHRRSVDFDFFRHQGFDPRELLDNLGGSRSIAVRRAERDTLTVEIDGVTTSFFAYPYAMLAAPRPSPWSVNLAAPEDIAAMKISAVAGRGARKDFVDLYFICQEVMPLSQVLCGFEKKFGNVPYERYHVLKSLTYFDDAEDELMPQMVRPVSWEGVKGFFQVEATKCFRES